VSDPATIESGSTAIIPARPDHLPEINDIYNHFVLHSTCTYQEQPETIESRRKWLLHHIDPYPAIVAVENTKVVGWGSLSPYHARSAYRFTVENSVYVHHHHHRRGIGSLLLADLIDRARSLGHHTLIAGIDSSQGGSITLHARLDFKPAGHMKQVGFKFGQWLDVVYLQRML
jgi:phosphinothricin acetyltransferase